MVPVALDVTTSNGVQFRDQVIPWQHSEATAKPVFPGPRALEVLPPNPSSPIRHAKITHLTQHHRASSTTSRAFTALSTAVTAAATHNANLHAAPESALGATPEFSAFPHWEKFHPQAESPWFMPHMPQFALHINT